MTSETSFGAWLARRRRGLGMTQADLARCAACSLSAIRKIETDERRPSQQVAELLAGCLHIPADRHATFLKVARGELRVEQLPEANIGTEFDLGALSQVVPRAPTRAHAVPATNLPAPVTPLVGREYELAELARLLNDPRCRLLTLAGPGGMGKTRLAIEAASAVRERFADGAFFIALAPVSSPDFIAHAIAASTGLTFHPANDVKTQLLNHLRNRNILLLIDNVEHLLDGIDVLVEILTHAPAVKLLATSRERLNLHGEWVFDVQGLPVPPRDDAENPQQYSAIALFAEVAQRVRAGDELKSEDWPAVARICRLVDGMPLGIELAATWLRVLSCEEIAQEIERSLDFLTASARDVAPRHRSLRAVFDHSWRLLPEHERNVLRRLAVFRGGFTREGAEQVAGASLPSLSSLVSRSLLYRMSQGRYSSHELLRQYGAAKLKEAGELEEARTRHLQFCVALAETAERHFTGPQAEEWRNSLEDDNDNFRAALAWALEVDLELGLRLATSLTHFWYNSHASEGRTWMTTVLRAAADAAVPISAAVHARALWHAAILEPYFAAGVAYSRAALARAREAGDKRSIANALAQLANDEWRNGRHAQADDYFDEALALFTELGDKSGMGTVYECRGLAERYRGRYGQAMALHEMSLGLAREMNSPSLLGSAEINLGILAIRVGDFTRARSLLEQNLARARAALNTRGQAWILMLLSRVAGFQAEYERANALIDESIMLHHQLGDPGPSAMQSTLQGDFAYYQGLLDQAGAHYREALARIDPEEKMDRATVLLGLGNVARARGDTDRALELLNAGLQLTESLNDRGANTQILCAVSQVYLSRGEVDRAEALFSLGLAQAQAMGDKRSVAQALEGLGTTAASRQQPAQAITLFGAAAVMREEIGAPMPPVDRLVYEDTLASARATLSPGDAASAWGRGRAFAAGALSALHLLALKSGPAVKPPPVLT